MHIISENQDYVSVLQYLGKISAETTTGLTKAFLWSWPCSFLSFLTAAFFSFFNANIYHYILSLSTILWIICGVVTFLLIIFRLYFQLRCLLSVSNKLEVLKSWLLCNNQTRYVPYNTSKDYYRVGAWLELQLVDLQNVFPYLRFIYDEKIRVYVELVFVLFIISLCIIHSRHY